MTRSPLSQEGSSVTRYPWSRTTNSSASFIVRGYAFGTSRQEPVSVGSQIESYRKPFSIRKATTCRSAVRG